MAYHIPSYNEILEQIQTAPDWHISDPFYNSLLFGTKLELQYLPSQIEAGEILYYIVPGKWRGAKKLLVITNRRLLFLDKKLWRRGQHAQIELSKINSTDVGGGFFFGYIRIKTGNDEPDEINGLWKSDTDRAYHALEKALNNLRHHEEAKQNQVVQTNTKADVVASLEKATKLFESGAIDKKEYEQLKKKILE